MIDSPDPRRLPTLALDPAEADTVGAIVDEAAVEHGHLTPELLTDLRVRAQRLPVRLREALVNVAGVDGRAGGLLITGNRVDTDRLGPTPGHWNEPSTVAGAAGRYEILLALHAATLGDLFGWTTQQDGHLVHDILPIREHADEQLGSGSKVDLTLHTEDAFHPYRPDFLVLMALRNPDHVPTRLTNVDWVANRSPILAEPRFFIQPDNSHLTAYNATRPAKNASAAAVDTAEAPTGILFGQPDQPFIRFDPYFTTVAGDDPAAADAVACFDEATQRVAIEIVLRPGDLLVVDNRLVIHGRPSYQPRWDGTDRWLKRANVAVDLRRSAHLRGSSRLI